MSFKENFESMANAAYDIAKERAQVTVTAFSNVVIENYESVKFFCDNKIILELSNVELDITGENLCIEYFSPMRVSVCGIIRTLTYTPQNMRDKSL